MESVRYNREEFVYQDKSDKYILNNRIFDRQYAHIYAVRLNKFKPMLEQCIEMKWGKDCLIRKLVDLKPNEKAVIIGTIYKQQELKPSILREISDEHQLLPLPPKSRYISPNDLLILEDELQRVLLIGNIKSGDYVTGVVIALLGHEDDTGKFVVEDICPANISCASPSKSQFSGPKYVAFLSGLDLGSSCDSLLSIQEMVFALVGKTGSPELQKMMSQIGRLIIAGNSLSSATQDREILDKARYLLKNNVAGSIEAVKTLDDIIFQLASSLSVDLMPGAHDPANFVLPQQALHQCMFPSSHQLPTFRTVSNPYCCRVGGRLFMGTSGQNVTDILKNSSLENSLDAMQKTLEWKHLCPTAPDTLGCYPFADDDPFIFEYCPEIYFAGNQDAFGDRVWKSSGGQSVRLISIPRFSETGTIVLVDTNTTECFSLQFGTETLKRD